ncbi:MAG: hypothetical protein II919_00765 [Lachnospiraceae bacterium]|nr:hypothetical protein [Lachnospiraceae bacterium]
MKKRTIMNRMIAIIMMWSLILCEPLNLYASTVNHAKANGVYTPKNEKTNEKSKGSSGSSDDTQYSKYFPNFAKLDNVKPAQPELIITQWTGEKEQKSHGEKARDLAENLVQTNATVRLIDCLDKGVQGSGDALRFYSAGEKSLLTQEINDINRMFFKANGEFQPGRTFEEYMEAISKAKNKAGIEGGKVMKNYAKVAPAMAVVSIGLNGYVAYNDIKDLAKGDLKNRTTTGKVLEVTGLVADAGVAIWGIVVTGAAVAGVTVAGVPLAVGVGIGLTAGALHSEWFAEWFHDYGKTIDQAASDSVQFVKDYWNISYEKAKDNTEFVWDYICEKLGLRTKVPNSVNCYKPNIYIYANAPKEVTVTFLRPDLLTKTIPDYRGLWHVNVLGDGCLENVHDNQYEDHQNYGYLFYESQTQTYFFQKEEAWLIHADTRKEQYEEILSEYGFNEQEIADFVEFWTEKLPQGTDYVMYPQETEIVDRAMPLTITPMPESCERLWFVFETYEGQEYEEAKAQRMEREDYAVVEWGGVILDE